MLISLFLVFFSFIGLHFCSFRVADYKLAIRQLFAARVKYTVSYRILT